MKKAANKKESAPVSLGTKRACPTCSIKFYDFGKPEVVCPKCQAKLDEAALNPVAKLTSKKARPVVEEETPAVVSDSEDVIESVDDLSDDEDEELVDDLVDEDEQESY